jgi:hypothetical protein
VDQDRGEDQGDGGIALAMSPTALFVIVLVAFTVGAVIGHYISDLTLVLSLIIVFAAGFIVRQLTMPD